jgi:hypothetical protein
MSAKDYTSFELIVDTNTGTTEHVVTKYWGGSLQISAQAISASGTLTITVIPWGQTEYEPVTNGVIELAAPQGVTIEGRFQGVKLTASNGADTYKLSMCG